MFIGALIKGVGDKLSPSGSFAGSLNKMFQGLQGPISNSVLHAFTFGGLEGWLTAKIGQPVGAFENKILSDAKTWASDVGNAVTGAWQTMAGNAKLWWGDITSTISGVATWLTGTFGTDLSNFFTKTIPGWLDALVNDVKSWATNIKSAFGAVWTWLSGTLGPDISGFFTKTLPGYFTDFYDAVVKTGGDIITWFEALPGKIISALGNLGSLLVNAGVQVVEGFIKGIGSKIADIGQAALNMVDALGSKVLKFLGIGSPSKVAHGWGLAVAQALATGMMAGHAAVAQAAQHLAGAAGMGAGPVTVPVLGPLGRQGGQRTASLGGGVSMADVVARLDKLIATTAAVPAGVGSHVGSAIGGAASAASFRSRYPRGGA